MSSFRLLVFCHRTKAITQHKGRSTTGNTDKGRGDEEPDKLINETERMRTVGKLFQTSADQQPKNYNRN